MPFLALPRHRDAAGGLIFCVCYFPFLNIARFIQQRVNGWQRGLLR